jgi:hypothetical protein
VDVDDSGVTKSRFPGPRRLALLLCMTMAVGWTVDFVLQLVHVFSGNPLWSALQAGVFWGLSDVARGYRPRPAPKPYKPPREWKYARTTLVGIVAVAAVAVLLAVEVHALTS